MNPIDKGFQDALRFLAEKIVKRKLKKKQKKMNKDSNGESGLGNISDFSFANSTESECDKTEDDFSDFEEEFYLHGYKGKRCIPVARIK